MPEPYRNKRLFDIAVAVAASVLAIPVSAVASAAIIIDDGTPVLFRQQRVGRDGEPFTILKFRTMDRSSPNVPSADAAFVRVTRVGRVLRRLNIDELPQLLNVIAGDMSIVGPRPALPSQFDVLEAREQVGVNGLRPGLTGLAQVSSYDNMPSAEKVRFDAKYAATQSLRVDLTILVGTLNYLLKTPPRY